MTTETKNGKVDQYDAPKKQLTCQWDPPDFVWKEGRVRTSGNRPSWCDPNSGKFDVTILPATAGLLHHDFEFPIEYVVGGTDAKKTVVMFAGQPIPPPPLAVSPGTLAVATSPSSQPPSSAPAE